MSVPTLNVLLRRLKISRLLMFFHYFLILSLSFLSCTGYKKQDSSIIDKTLEEKNDYQRYEEKETLADLIIVKDILNKDSYSLRKISAHMPVFIEVSASWCPACKDMGPVVLKLNEYFEGEVFFVKLFMADDAVLNENETIPVMEIVSSPENLKIENSEILPRVIILSRKGEEVIADINGVYPLLYYYGILSEL